MIDTEGGLGWVNRALQIKPKSAEAYELRGRIRMEERKFEEAAKDFKQVIGLDPGLTTARLNLVTALLRLKRHEQALATAAYEEPCGCGARIPESPEAEP